jgi:ATP-binding cassette subfamily B protein
VLRKKFVRQENVKDCGAACLLMIMRHYGGDYPLERLREMMETDKRGTTAYNLIKVAKEVGFDARGYRCDECADLKPHSIAHVIINKTYNHFVVVEKVDINSQTVTIADPASGLKKYSFDEFKQVWTHIIITFYPIRKIDNINAFESVKKTIYQIIDPHKKLLIFVLFLSIIYTMLSIINTFYFKIIIDNTTLSTTIYICLFIFFLLLGIIKVITDLIRNKLLIYINQKIDITLMENTFKHLLSLPFNYFNSRTTGDIISRINDLSYVRDLISRSIVIVLLDLVLIIGSMTVMFYINYKLFIITIFIFAIYFCVVYIFNNTIKYFIVKNQEISSIVSSSLVETISGIKTIKNLGVEGQAYNNVIGKYKELVNNNYMFDKKYNMIKALKDFIAGGGLLYIMFLGSLFISSKILSVGDFVVFNFFLGFFLEPMKNIFEVEPLLKASSNALIRISEFLNIEKDFLEDDGQNIKGKISLNNLSFAYNNLDNVIDNVNFDIQSGEKIMINGSSGSGKSTIAKMIMRYLEVRPNQIMIDDSDILDYSVTSIRRNICYVSQDETIFTDSLYNNVTLNREVDKNVVDRIFNIIYVDEICERHNLDYHMLLEENGTNISGGERQRIIIARALLKCSQVFIFDESMSEMNISLERNILKNIFDNYSDKTIIVMSHRMDNADLFDHVITFDEVKQKNRKGVVV